MRGRRPKPTALKALAGNPGKRPLNDQEPQFDHVLPEKPKGMARAASREWDHMAPLLLSRGVLTNVDSKAFAAYCDTYALWEMARKDLLHNGLVIDEPLVNKKGDVVGSRRKTNPAFTVYANCAKLMKTFLIEFGLTPASRAKLRVEAPKQADPMQDLLTKRPGMEKIEQPNAPAYFDTGSESDLADKISEGDISFDA